MQMATAGCFPIRMQADKSEISDAGVAISLIAPVGTPFMMASNMYREWYLSLVMRMLNMLGVCMQAESRRAQQVTKLAQELSHKLAQADA